jgi:hypothetical protein
MKRWITVIVVVLAVSPLCGAQTTDAAKEAKVHEMFDVMHMSKMMDTMMGAVTQMVHQMADSTPGMENATPKQKKIISDFEDKAMKLAMNSMSWKALEPDYVKIYAANFSMDEIDAITKFYSSTAGQAMLDKTPELTTASMKVVQEKIAILQPQLKELQEQLVKELANAEPAPGKATKPPSY